MPRIFRVQPLRARLRQKGTTLVLFTLISAFVLIPMAGLAFDMSIVFWAKAKLSAAVDAAVLAAGRNVNVYDTTSQNSGTVANIAQQWFWANFPKGWLGTTIVGGQPTVSYVTTSSSTQQVTVSVSANIPLYFASLAGFKSLTVSAQAQSSRRNTFVVLVLDRSGSMNLNTSGINACSTMQADAISFADKFTENFDTMGLITFSTTANYNAGSSNPIDYGPNTVFKSGMASTINSLSCNGWTSTAQALNAAYQTIQNNGGLKGGLNVIVLFTDGQPNTIVANFPVMNSAVMAAYGGTKDTRYGAYPTGYSQYGLTSYYNALNSQTGPSGCSSTALTKVNSTITGAVAAAPYPNFSGTISPAQLGMTEGFYDPFTWVSTNSIANLLSGSTYSGCNFNLSSYGHEQGFEPRFDMAYLPTQDYYKNYLAKGYNGASGYYGANSAAAPLTFPSTSGYLFKGQLRPDEEEGAITPAAINAADYQAQVIRNDSDYNIVIYTIGLGGAPDYAIDYTLLERMANDPRSPIYDNTKTAGLFAYASDPSQLNTAFTNVAGQILKLTK